MLFNEVEIVAACQRPFAKKIPLMPQYKEECDRERERERERRKKKRKRVREKRLKKTEGVEENNGEVKK